MTKTHIYILSILFFFTISCANHSAEKSINEPAKVEQNAENERFEKNIKPDHPAPDDADAADITQADFDEVSFQKLQQALDIYTLMNRQNAQTGFNDYAGKHLTKMWLHPGQARKQLADAGLQKFDSVQVAQVKLLKFSPFDQQESKALYEVKLKAFSKGKMHPIKKKLQMFYKIDELNIDGVVYKTITGKILKIQ